MNLLREDAFDLSTILISVHIALIVLVALAFVAYDRSMLRAHALIQRNAAKSTEFVSSMFPADLHRRLFDTSITELKVPDSSMTRGDKVKSPKPKMKARRKSSMGVTATDTRHDDGTYKSKPIAELYPETTIMVRRCLLHDNILIRFSNHLVPLSFGFCSAGGFSRIYRMEFRT